MNYYIEIISVNGKSSGNYYVYDIEYDNYYQWSNNGKTIMWYNYKGAWQTLK